MCFPEIDAEVGLLIGNNVPDAYMPLEIRTGPRGSPHATRSLLGWIAWNVIREECMDFTSPKGFAVNHAEIATYTNLEEMNRLDRMLRQHVEFEFPERTIDDKREHSQEDKRFLDKVSNTIKYNSGHYEIGLPFKGSDICLPNNRQQAMQRLKGLEKKFTRDKKFHEDYEKFMMTIMEKGYAEKVPSTEVKKASGQVWYIPHHGVYHSKKPEKIRVVFDCAASYEGISLNQMLLQGPDLTSNLLGVLLRFREEKIAVMADVESMFYQVKVPKTDSDFLRFLWWPDGDYTKCPEEYRMLVHLFGAVSSPSCANYALRRTAEDNKESFDEKTTNTVLHNFYVDDCLKSVSNQLEAITLVQSLINICNKGGFRLTKWVSNNRAVLDSIPSTELAKEFKLLKLGSEGIDKLPVERALGVHWSVELDSFGFDISLKDRPPTRRTILSDISSVYDPLGFAAPVILIPKILLQSMCKQGVGWNDILIEKDLEIWINWLKELPLLNEVAIPRCLKSESLGEVKTCQMHCFSDASQYGYGIVIYLRYEDYMNQVHISFVIGKSRVAPLKKVSIPRMELTAATTAVRMKLKLQNELECSIDQCYFWTDSMTVLRYIANETTRFHTFVANRLNVIHEATDPEDWKYVPTDLNPADDASRGLTASKFLCSQRWFQGPDFLRKDVKEWPKTNEKTQRIPDTDPELKKSVNVTVDATVSGMDSLLQYFSKWTKLKRAAAVFIAFKMYLKLLPIRNEQNPSDQRLHPKDTIPHL